MQHVRGVGGPRGCVFHPPPTLPTLVRFGEVSRSRGRKSPSSAAGRGLDVRGGRNSRTWGKLKISPLTSCQEMSALTNKLYPVCLRFPVLEIWHPRERPISLGDEASSALGGTRTTPSLTLPTKFFKLDRSPPNLVGVETT